MMPRATPIPMTIMPGIRLAFICSSSRLPGPVGLRASFARDTLPPPSAPELRDTAANSDPTLEVRMRRLVVLLAILCFQPRTARAVTVDEIVARNIEAHGGLARLRGLRSLRLTGKLAY